MPSHGRGRYSITTNQAAIIALFRNLPPMPGVFPDYPAPVVRNAAGERELTHDALGNAASAACGRVSRHQYPQHHFASLARLVEAGKSLLGPGKHLRGIRAGAKPQRAASPR
jgi:hypothetical protein